jgi:hypothetical protein
MSVVLPCCPGWAEPTIGYFRALKSAASDVLAQPAGVDDPGDPQCPPEGPTPLRLRETGRIGMDVRPTSPQSALRIGHEHYLMSDADVLTRDDPQQLGGWCPSPTAHAGALR